MCGILAGYPKARVDLVPAFHLAIPHPPSAARHNANLEHRIRTWPCAQPVIRFKPLDCIVNNPRQRAARRYVTWTCTSPEMRKLTQHVQTDSKQSHARGRCTNRSRITPEFSASELPRLLGPTAQPQLPLQPGRFRHLRAPGRRCTARCELQSHAAVQVRILWGLPSDA